MVAFMGIGADSLSMIHSGKYRLYFCRLGAFLIVVRLIDRWRWTVGKPQACVVMQAEGTLPLHSHGTVTA